MQNSFTMTTTTGATENDETIADASIRQRVRDFNRRRDVVASVVVVDGGGFF